jgi:hypothetical protein
MQPRGLLSAKKQVAYRFSLHVLVTTNQMLEVHTECNLFCEPYFGHYLSKCQEVAEGWQHSSL